MKPARLLMPFSTLEEYFAAVRGLAADIEASGYATVAAEIREGFRCLNGLTDGWALFLETLDGVCARPCAELSREQRALLADIRRVAHRITHRR